MSIYGSITVQEQCFKYQGHVIRPFSHSAKVQCRQYSRSLERRVTDLGADSSFQDAARKIVEHYGLELSRTSIKNTTFKHAHKMLKSKKSIHKNYPKAFNPKVIVGEIDGTMVPTVETDVKAKDRRKKKTLSWKETCLSLAYVPGSIDPCYDATLGSKDKAGQQLAGCVKRVGQVKKTHIHCVGDGALWITDQVDKKFGSLATYLIDFYHLSEYIAKAATCCCPDTTKSWISTMKACMKENRSEVLLQALKDHLESVDQQDHVCEAERCYNYLIKRMHQIDYKGALDNKLPIGSGRVESGHRSVIQKRLKMPGAWWTTSHVEEMLALRVTRANGLWDMYWQAQTKEIGTTIT